MKSTTGMRIAGMRCIVLGRQLCRTPPIRATAMLLLTGLDDYWVSFAPPFFENLMPNCLSLR